MRANDEDNLLTADLAPPNSVLLIMDRTVGQIPESMVGVLIAHTPTCVTIGTLSEHDGTTHVILDDGSSPSARSTPVFTSVLDTPGRKVSVCSVLDDTVLEVAVATARTRVSVWANDPKEPSEIHVRVEADVA